MTEAETILKMIETVDPSNTANLDMEKKIVHSVRYFESLDEEAVRAEFRRLLNA
jgi:hypothetical protein